jgi:hypothetical protein
MHAKSLHSSIGASQSWLHKREANWIFTPRRQVVHGRSRGKRPDLVISVSALTALRRSRNELVHEVDSSEGPRRVEQAGRMQQCEGLWARQCSRSSP